MKEIKYRYSALYRDIAECPELSLYPRYGEIWAWILYDHCAEIARLEKDCNALIAEQFPDRIPVYTVTDIHRVHIEEGDGDLKARIQDLKKAIREYSEDSRLAHAMAQLPEQSRVFTDRFRRYGNLFENGAFGPTGESEMLYNQVPSHPDMWSLKALDRQDVLSDFLIRHIEWIAACIQHLLFWRRSAEVENQSIPGRVEGIALDSIRGPMNLVAGLYGPLLFTSSMAIVSCISSMKIQIAVVGILGGVLVVSFQLLVENVKRAESFSIMAGYYAVLGIFIGATNSGPIAR